MSEEKKISIGIATCTKLLLYRLYINYMIPRILKKEKIKVLFVLAEISTWKSELLYLSMLNHPRFEPIIGIVTSQESPGAKSLLINYLNKKGYSFIDLDEGNKVLRSVNADFVFYYKPYEASYPSGLFFNKNLKTIPCSINYGFPVDGESYIYRTIYASSYLSFVENAYIESRNKSYLGYWGKNIVHTGVPMQDLLLLPKMNFEDPWKDKKGRIRIIYAPHHSIPGTNGEGVEYGTFLKYGEYILELAKKYSDVITIAFKPHPNLFKKLLNIWGKKKTEAYYRQWEELKNTQLEKGEYVGLFKHSDALIHDSCSFIVEYQYAERPSMFLYDGDTNKVKKTINEFGQAGLKCHVSAFEEKDIETFILNMLDRKDPKQAIRANFIEKYLTPPNGKTACDNIINAILRTK